MYKLQFLTFISPICLEAPSGWISTKFGMGGPLADVINCAEFFVDRFRCIDFLGHAHRSDPWMDFYGRYSLKDVKSRKGVFFLGYKT